MENDTKFKIEAELNGRKFSFYCDKDTPFKDVHDVLSNMQSYVVDQLIKALQNPEGLIESKKEVEIEV